MKKLMSLIFITFIVIISSHNIYAQTSSKVILQGGIETNVPKTPDEVTAYLIKMKSIMSEYDQLGTQLVGVMTGDNPDISTGTSAKNEWIRLAKKIYAITPPQELTLTHKKLADSLNQTSSFLDNLYSNGGSPQSPQALLAIVGQVSTLSNAAMAYQSGVSHVISRMGLDPSLNPLGANTNSIDAGSLLKQFQF